MHIRVALALGDLGMQKYLAQELSGPDVRVESFRQAPLVWQKVLRSGCDVIVIAESVIPPPTETGITILNQLPENPTTVVIHGNDSSEQHAELVAAGADVILYAGVSKRSLSEAIETTLESRRRFIQSRQSYRRGFAEPKISDFASESQVMQIFMDEVLQVIPSDSPILLLGETGVGKEHLAKAIHAESPRSVGPFISVNTAALPEQLLESELFGHEQGAFTGALRYRRGAFELAHGGTIFLDEVGEMPLYMQTKLLQVLQNYEVRPIGGENITWVDVRVIAATSRDLEAEIAQNGFRQDLYFRLGVLTLKIPPLRYRKEDLPAMVRRFLSLNRHKLGREVNGISAQALLALTNYSWPGNVRELMNVIERAVLLCKTNELSIVDLPPSTFRSDGSVTGPILPLEGFGETEWLNKPLRDVQKDVLDQVERRYLELALRKTEGRVDRAARIAGIHPRGLYNKMKRLGLRKEDFKTQQP